MPASPSVEKLFGSAKRAVRDQNWPSAYDAYATVLNRFPANNRAKRALQDLKPKALPAILTSAQEFQGAGEWVQAERHLHIAADLAPEITEVQLALAACQLELGRAPAALRTADRILQRHPQNRQALIYKGRAEREMGLNSAAERSFLAALHAGQPDANTLNNLGITARARGDTTAAIEHYQQALALDPDSVELHQNLAQAKSYTADDPHLAEMRTLATRLITTRKPAAPLHFALFKALDDAGQPDEAFRFLQSANRMAKEQAPYDFQADAIAYAVSKSILKTPMLAEPTDAITPRPIFVTGLPRSGTTLVERILTMDPEVQAGGEMTVTQLAVGTMLKTVMGRDDKRLGTADLNELRAEISAGLAEYTDGRPVIIDKTPLNFRWIGYICAALPEARFVHVTRDPASVAWSLYRLSFNGGGNGFIYDFSDIAKFMVVHRNFMAHWQAVYPNRIFDLGYEALIANPESETRAMAAATGLNWTEDWLHPEKATNQVLTASSDQVRKPMYQGSNAQWQCYENHLKPMIRQLQDADLLDG